MRYRIYPAALPLFLLIVLFHLPQAAEANENRPENRTVDTPGSHLDVVQQGRVIARYMYAHDTKTDQRRHETYKPYLHVMAGDGKTPITKGAGGKFTHHRGIFLGWNRIGFQGKNNDLWHMKTSEIIHREFLETVSADDRTTVKVRLHWMDAKGQVILDEVRSMEFDHTDPKALFCGSFRCELTAVNDKVTLNGDPEHAGFQYRPTNEVAENKSAKYLFHKQGINPKKDRDLPWVALNYEAGGKKYSVQHMNHPGNPKGSIYSAYRDYGRFGSFPKVDLEKGERLQLEFRIRVTEGEMPTRESLAAEYEKYVR